MIRYYCSGFDHDNAFGHGLGDMFKEELVLTKNIVYIPNPDKIDKARDKFIPIFRKHFKNVGISFENEFLLTPEMNILEAKNIIRTADFILLLGGDPFKQKELCNNLGIIDELKNYKGVMLGFSAGAMLMSKYIIVTPCSEKYPEFHIEDGLNLDGISIYPHNNTTEEQYPENLVVGNKTYKKEDFLKVANQYGEFYLLQDHYIEDDKVDISIIKSTNGSLEYYKENNGKIWIVNSEDIILRKDKIKTK